jgi:AraC-like DNA-binding protein
MLKRLFPKAMRMPDVFRVFGLAMQERMRAGMVNRQHGSEHWILIFFYSEAVVESGGRRATLPPHSLILWAPRMPQGYGHPTKAWNHAWMVFDGSEAKRLLKDPSIGPIAPVIPLAADSGEIEFYLNGFYREMSNRAEPDAAILTNLFVNWLREIKRQASTDECPRPVPQDFRALRRYLHESFNRPITLDDLAKRMHMSRWHLCRAFRKHFGQTPMESLQAIRMQHAALLLRDVNLSVSAVGLRTGYEDLFHFSKQFKKHYGMSPRAMRAHL